MNTGHAAAEEIPKISLKGNEKSAPRSRPAPSDTTRAEMTIKGKTEGMTVPMQSEIPLLTSSAAFGEKMRKKTMTESQTRADGTALFLL